MSQTTSNLLYLVTIICFILALRFLSCPKHARLGNRIGAVGMAIAIVVTALQTGVHIGWRDDRRRRDRRGRSERSRRAA